jgi:hypothetical protein
MLQQRVNITTAIAQLQENSQSDPRDASLASVCRTLTEHSMDSPFWDAAKKLHALLKIVQVHTKPLSERSILLSEVPFILAAINSDLDKLALQNTEAVLLQNAINKRFSSSLALDSDVMKTAAVDIRMKDMFPLLSEADLDKLWHEIRKEMLVLFANEISARETALASAGNRTASSSEGSGQTTSSEGFEFVSNIGSLVKARPDQGARYRKRTVEQVIDSEIDRFRYEVRQDPSKNPIAFYQDRQDDFKYLRLYAMPLFSGTPSQVETERDNSHLSLFYHCSCCRTDYLR